MAGIEARAAFRGLLTSAHAHICRARRARRAQNGASTPTVAKCAGYPRHEQTDLQWPDSTLGSTAPRSATCSREGAQHISQQAVCQGLQRTAPPPASCRVERQAVEKDRKNTPWAWIEGASRVLGPGGTSQPPSPGGQPPCSRHVSERHAETPAGWALRQGTAHAAQAADQLLLVAPRSHACRRDG